MKQLSRTHIRWTSSSSLSKFRVFVHRVALQCNTESRNTRFFSGCLQDENHRCKATVCGERLTVFVRWVWYMAVWCIWFQQCFLRRNVYVVHKNEVICDLPGIIYWHDWLVLVGYSCDLVLCLPSQAQPLTEDESNLSLCSRVGGHWTVRSKKDHRIDALWVDS